MAMYFHRWVNIVAHVKRCELYYKTGVRYKKYLANGSEIRNNIMSKGI